MCLIHRSEWCLSVSANGRVDLLHLTAKFSQLRVLRRVSRKDQLRIWELFYEKRIDELLQRAWKLEKQPLVFDRVKGAGNVVLV